MVANQAGCGDPVRHRRTNNLRDPVFEPLIFFIRVGQIVGVRANPELGARIQVYGLRKAWPHRVREERNRGECRKQFSHLVQSDAVGLAQWSRRIVP